MNPWLAQALFLAIPLALLGLMMLATKLAVRRGWIVLRREPTEYELAIERVRVALNETAEAIRVALLPALIAATEAINRIAEVFRKSTTDEG